MDAKQFYARFREAVYEDRDINGKRLYELYRSNTDYTAAVTGILNEIVDEAGYTHQNEYFRIDVSGWISHSEEMEQDARESGIDINAHFWDLKVAIEHENSLVDWSDEVIKLVHVKCPLKVIIGYSHCDERGEKEVARLDFVTKWMKKVDAFGYGGNEEYLIILGNAARRKKNSKDYDSFGYVGYLYNGDSGRFERI